MRHRIKTIKLGRSQAHRDSLLANQVCSLIEHSRIKTTLAKAKAVRPLAEKMVTLGKNGSLHARRTALAVLNQRPAVKKLFDVIAPRAAARKGGYTRIIKLGLRKSDAAPIAFIEWVDAPVAEEPAEVTPPATKRRKASSGTATAADVPEKAPKKARSTKAAAAEEEGIDKGKM